MVLYEALDEPVAVVVPFLLAVLHRMTVCRSAHEGLWQQLFLFEKIVFRPLVNEDGCVCGACVLGDELGGIVRLPRLFVGPQVAAECLFAPGAIYGVADGSKRGTTLVHAWIFQVADKGTMASHAMSRDGATGSDR